MKYSFIVPTYNEEQYVRKCLQSIRDQQYDRTQFETILSDAESTDSTREVAEALCDKIVTARSRGIAIGRNLGARSAAGDYLVFVDADAVLEQDFLSNLDRSFRDEKVVAVSGVAKPSDGRLFPRFVYRMTYLLAHILNVFGLSLFPGISVAYRRSAFEGLRGFREDFGIVEDLDLSRRMSAIGKCVVNPRAVAYVSTRRLENHAVSTVLFHIFSDIKYLVTGRAAKVYPKREELRSWSDLWKTK